MFSQVSVVRARTFSAERQSTRCRSTSSSWTCNVCEVSVPKGSLLYSCRDCDWDGCGLCFSKVAANTDVRHAFVRVYVPAYMFASVHDFFSCVYLSCVCALVCLFMCLLVCCQEVEGSKICSLLRALLHVLSTGTLLSEKKKKTAAHLWLKN